MKEIPATGDFEYYLGGLKLRISFFCRKHYKNSKGKSPIVLRIHYNKERRDLFTGLYCQATLWNSNLANLNPIRENIFKIIEDLKYNGSTFTIDELVAKLKGEGRKLNDYLETEIKKLKRRVGVDLSLPTFYKYMRIASLVQGFLTFEYRQKDYPVQRIDNAFLEKYFQYLRTEKKISHNSSVKYLRSFKTMLMPAIRAGHLKKDCFRELKLKERPVANSFLTQEEIGKLENVVFKSPDLERIRDIFLFCCYTGLAYIDVKHLSKNQSIFNLSCARD